MLVCKEDRGDSLSPKASSLSEIIINNEIIRKMYVFTEHALLLVVCVISDKHSNPEAKTSGFMY
ncbi:hypothetical protein A0O36_00839 [Piscirickettsiaceae bacterium NZ-RLO1]|nr:hypothetical protein A0O36_00839 [Piscirickettsiaceae bacterium NZ-RLO1]